jgi:hypothetical protein
MSRQELLFTPMAQPEELVRMREEKAKAPQTGRRSNAGKKEK